LFGQHLAELRNLAPVTTICAHGSPLSPFDNKLLWQKYDYKSLGIIGDAHLDTNWNEIAYLTDTGRRWDGADFSVRDKIPSPANPVSFNSPTRHSGDVEQSETSPESGIKKQSSAFRSTFDIINALQNNQFPGKVMLTIHPERWNDNLFWWTEELITQNIKNIIKKHFFVKK